MFRRNFEVVGVVTQGLSDDSLMGGTFHSVSLGAYNPAIQEVKLQDQDPGDLMVTSVSLEPNLLYAKIQHLNLDNLILQHKWVPLLAK